MDRWMDGCMYFVFVIVIWHLEISCVERRDLSIVLYNIKKMKYISLKVTLMFFHSSFEIVKNKIKIRNTLNVKKHRRRPMRTLPRIRKRNAGLSDFAKKIKQQSNRKSIFEILQTSCFERFIRTYQRFEKHMFLNIVVFVVYFLRFSRNIKLNIKYVI